MSETLKKYNEKWIALREEHTFDDVSDNCKDFFLNSMIISGKKRDEQYEGFATSSEVLFSYDGGHVSLYFDEGDKNASAEDVEEGRASYLDENFEFNETPIHDFFGITISEGFIVEEYLSSFPFSTMLRELEKEAVST